MPKLDRYLFREFTQSFLATLIILLMVSVGGVMADLLGKVADGRVPARLLLSQLGLQFLGYMPYIVPLALMLGLLLSFSRLYRDSEMAVLTGIGVGPARLLKPLLLLVVPVVLLVGACSLWLGPWALRTADSMLEQANRSLVVSGLDAGKFTVLSSGAVVYIGGLSDDGTRLQRVFMHRQKDDRIDVVTAKSGQMFFEGERSRYLRLEDGFRVEGPADQGLDYRLMRYASNEVALPERADTMEQDDPQRSTTLALLGDERPAANAQLHARLTPPLLALAFALLTLPLSRSAPRQTRYGRVMLGFLAYLVGVSLMFNGTQLLADGKLPGVLGLWWLTLPLLAAAAWFYWRDGQVSRPRLRA
ncbi:LPS export ABC transporter permease LptF [Pseudoxanthomonas wuyuanensis]|uniref:Lipopolysaccharide export system permease protein LptF n=1 Tax=Pseudoxanthomonas wuyuanensis TaxID=1073196 RepID=A0A286DC48_9GAMM|nr:LPS export ABC transporter permease LptF [Pseudoxanthomonas wuyuanensis]KAF1716574.1 LPS export ABC transporter permease LptF [Pseudoxanthomonas wuyuanensis]SOD56213.1 lipopolysaccharide export system permease protein [Pseudoxanthomonas wuyuanensis]